ncbi:hypothetical protein HQ590_11095, partial [bacterium]|nr:hypothetical protein [bacterium]
MQTVSLSLLWPAAPGAGRVHVANGRLEHRAPLQAQRNIDPADGSFDLGTAGPARLDVAVGDARLAPGPGATIIRVDTAFGSFSFFLRDLPRAGPLVVPDARAVVTGAEDQRAYEQIVAAATAGRRPALAALESGPEPTWDQACR